MVVWGQKTGGALVPCNFPHRSKKKFKEKRFLQSENLGGGGGGGSSRGCPSSAPGSP